MKRTTRPGSARAGRKKAGTALVPVGTTPKNAVAVMTTEAGGTLYREKGTTLIVNEPHLVGDRAIMADAVYFVDGLKSGEQGPWLGEADKVAWRDEATGYECIIMRASRGGYLGGYVGILPGHPLYGFDHAAIPPELGIEVHGGITYSHACEHGPTPARSFSDEARRICHVARPGAGARRTPITHASDYRVEADDAWWLGFECNHVYDLVPANSGNHGRFLAAETGPVYRDEGYVYREVAYLAEQLHAIASGLPRPERTGPPRPPLGLDPREED